MKEIKAAKAAQAGMTILAHIIEYMAARRPDLVDAACAEVLGLGEDVGGKAFNAAMDKKVDHVTTFDPIVARIEQLEKALRKAQRFASQPHISMGTKVMTERPDIARICRDALKYEE